MTDTTPKKRHTHIVLEQLTSTISGLRADIAKLQADKRQPPTLTTEVTPPKEIKKVKSFQTSPQHEAIFSAMIGEGPGLITVAVAGAGKTSTLVEGTKRLREARPNERMAFVAFNRSVVQTLRGKLPPEVSVNTIHSICVRSVKKQYNWQQDDRIQHGRIMDAAWRFAKGAVPKPELSELVRHLASLWGLAVNTMTSLTDEESLKKMAVSYGHEADIESPAFKLVADMDAYLRSDTQTTSFDEILRICHEEETPLETTDSLIIDETQDLNRLQMAILKRLQPKRVIAVGDPKQSIYAFRGSDHRAIDVLAQHFNITTRLPLSTTYRCSKAVVQEAQRLVREIQALPDAPEGEVIERDPEDVAETLASLQPGDLVLSRNNAPLMQALLQGIHKYGWTRACIISGDGGDKLLLAQLTAASEAAGSDNVLVVLEWVESQGLARAQRLEDQGQMAAASRIRDQTKTIKALLSQVKTMQEAHEILERFSSTKIRRDAINLSTIHRAKGLEADRVVILGHNEIPNRQVLASGNRALVAQEWNLLYVAITRARTTLIKQAIDPDDFT